MTPRRRLNRSVSTRTTLILVSLALGVASTILISQILLVAVLGAVISRPPVISVDTASPRNFAFCLIDSRFGVSRAMAGPELGTTVFVGFVRYESISTLPNWVAPDLDNWFTTIYAQQRYGSYYAVSCGFPFRCLSGERRSTYLPNVPATTGTRDDTNLSGWPPAWTPGFLNPAGRREFLLPTRPLPIGFAANTAVYACAWFVVLCAPVSIKTWRRRRRGQCVKCAYDLTGVTESCPECGAASLTPPSTHPSRV